ncbi:MAG: bifunctional 3,4-dihydroxy-2-butanone-4-phosphate synthase/GTP cyclohydrolase II, partial [Gammaproteobacteria bacterium]|nr:bifunctional 3,4-dihydroxy-2-butanone-4-phosphate synthase/GTP cyclohydrolase II [Gammaproteobacteria bacterium]
DVLVDQIRDYAKQDEGIAVTHNHAEDLRTFGIGAQILSDLGVTKMRVLSAPKKMHALSGFGLEVVEYVHD